MKKYSFLLTAALTLPMLASAQKLTPIEQADLAYFSEQCKIIGSDAFGGRMPLTQYEDTTINYLAAEMKRLGLEPAFGDSYFQEVKEISTVSRPKKNRVTVKGAKSTLNLKFPDDLCIWTHRGTNKIDTGDAEYVFCGFGIEAPEYNWHDFEGVDVKGKIVIAMVNDPGFYDEKLFRGGNMTYYGRWTYKLEQAQKLGAAGCLILHNTAAASYGWNVCARHQSSNLGVCHDDMNLSQMAIEGWIQEDATRKIFEAAGEDFDKALAAAKRPGFKPFVLKAKSRIQMDVTYTVGTTHNVAGLMRGTDKQDELLVFNAHWDHFGYGEPDEKGDSIYNGAADNASGVATVLALAKKFKTLPIKPRRSLLFMSVTSEESGLFGSEVYCENPAPGFPMEKTVACINFDCVAPLDLTNDVPILGGSECDIDNRIMAAAAAQGRYIYTDTNNQDGWFFRSDHFNFIKKGVPAVVIRNGKDYVDPEAAKQTPLWADWYHKPCDEWSDDWHLDGTMANLRMMFSVGIAIANDEERPKWLKK